MSRKLIVCAIVVALVAAVAPTATGAAVKTKVQIGSYSYFGMGNGGQFQIEVKSEKKACKNKRKVTLFRNQLDGPEKIGAKKTISGEGTYVAIINDPLDPTEDGYYATVKKENGCADDKSPDYFPNL